MNYEFFVRIKKIKWDPCEIYDETLNIKDIHLEAFGEVAKFFIKTSKIMTDERERERERELNACIFLVRKFFYDQIHMLYVRC